MKILIIGGGGFIGSWLTKKFTDNKHEVTIVDPFYCFSGLNEETVKKVYKYRRSKLLDKATIVMSEYDKVREKIYDEFEPDVVIHLAATPLEKPDDLFISTRQVLKDIPLTYQVITDVAKSNVKKFVFMSSIFAYGNYQDWSVSESVSLNPTTLYGISKATGEFLVRTLLDEKEWLILRTTSVYGFADTNLRATQIFMDKAFRNEPFWVNKDSWPDFIYIKDLVDGIYTAITSDLNKDVFHISGGKAVSLLEYVETMSQYFPDINYEVKENLNDRPRRGTMDNTKARVMLNWRPSYDLDKGIEDYMKYVKKYKHG